MAKQLPRPGRTGRHFGARVNLKALGLCVAFAALPLYAAEPARLIDSALQSSHGFDIPAQALAGALISFGQQSGLQVTVDATLLAGRTSTAVSGTLSNQRALDRLLTGTGVSWDYQYASLIFRRTDAQADIDGPMEIGNTVVLGNTRENSYQGETVISQQAIQAFPGANGDITTLLRMHPSVQFSNTAQSSNTPGEIAPADISINGAKYYQNNFMIDGVSINNDLDPGAHDYNAVRQFDSSPSRSHGIALDADLLKEVRVYDSNVPAEYGGFNGGVVDAITRQPTQTLHGKISAAMTRSEWTRYHISEADQDDFANASNEQYQPEFDKLTVRGTLEGHLTEDFGAILNFSQKRSTIPLNAYADGYQSDTGKQTRDQTRRLDNYLIKTYWNVNDRLTLDTSFTYAPEDNSYFVEDRLNSGWTTQNGGYQGNLKATWSGDLATWTHSLSVTQLTSSRDADADDVTFWYWSPAKNWGNPDSSTARSVDGGFGDLEQSQKSLAYSLKSAWLPVTLWGLEHTFVSGLELTHTAAEWERPTTVNSVSGFRRDNGTTCATGDSLCSVSPLLNGSSRQWASTRVIYGAGKISVDENKYAYYLQDSLQLGRLGLRPGVRLEGDDYMEKKTIAPRFAGDYDFFGDRSTVLVFGANRYYGRNLFKYRLADGRGELNTTQTRSSYTGAWTSTVQKNTNKFSTLDIPYDDELMLGLDQRWLDTDFRLKYVHRTGKDKIVRASAGTQSLASADGYTTNYYTYTNNGYSESDNVSLSITPIQDFQFRGTRTSLQLAFDWSRTKDAYGTYDDIVTANEYIDSDVIYDGQRMKYSELPAADFNRPWTARLTAITEIPQWNLTLSNFLRYRGPYDQIVSTSDTVDIDGETLKVYEASRVAGAPTWDMRVNWEVPTGPEQAVFVAVDVTNVTDKVNGIVGSSGSTTYETGRQFWLEVGYRF
ncbi:TonB-dependent receptor [Pseudomonas abieticivorans]|uniref:TonB-dependent receptor n=1 Tax=Pseudomonas abieticivorans TaxID=2931382 RepID=UPI0020BDD2B8|nr:TonB-dependent receptor [Pseudomonas sp. PIA16]